MPIILTTIILTSLIVTPIWMLYSLKLHEACRLLKAKRDHLLLKPEDQVKNKDITNFLRSVGHDVTLGR